ncbi:SusD/RagB family nutrient-binding outer membrane lipoprotein [Aestuariibaculum lutulentum]|uniref:SusD/RagB family nutrient-binding outer membrane lipoprotein n=1 Tax=Aestuariibaculum lutulentum TaxID=2920935 RepID=A0ABS9RLL1_9FLAO|nr:SusD/RagB family nutrient-binding outer membrane lipoprotein [Aestuariibaculum lutulentum]MCH4553848.1 SusD/RagB family nutrient-binding outer membrane lipoprotein [Aestuariibaculum lutulentum]
MKNLYLRLTLSILIVFSATNCSELDDLYQDPDGFSKEQADAAGVSIIAGYFTSQLTRGFFLRGEYGAAYHQLRSGSRVMGTGVQLYYTTSDYGLSLSLRDVEGDWGSNGFNRTVFNKINSDWIKQYLWAQKEYNKIPEESISTSDELYMRLLHLLKAVAYQRAIDLYDEVPYFETGTAGALDGEKASWVGQEEIYPIIIDEVKEIESFLEGLTLGSAEATLFSQQDVIFGGDIMQWRKYANSLRLRWAMNVSEQLPSLTSTVLTELNGKPLFNEAEDVAGLADIAIVEPYRLQRELGITRAFRERADECRAPKRFLHDVMNCIPTEKSILVNGEMLYYFDGDNSEEGLVNGTVDPRVTYLFSKDVLGRYVGAETTWDDGSDPNSYFSKAMRGYYINDPIMTDINVTEISFGASGNEMTIKLNDEAATDLTKREAFLLKAFREYCSQYSDISWTIGTDRNMISEYNVRPQYNFDIRYPTLHSVETELSLAEAAVRGFGSGDAATHYKNAIELSCAYWYDKNVNNSYSQTTTPAFPGNMDASRIDRDRPSMEYNPGAYAEFAAQQFSAMTDQQKVKAIFDQLQLHYNMFNFETPYTAARRLIKYLNDNPAAPYETFAWKERMLYNPSIQGTDPEAWSQVSQHDDYNLPIWFTGRTTKWKNVLE